MASFYLIVSHPGIKGSDKIQGALTSRKHALHKIPNVTENHTKPLCSSLLACQRFDLYTLKDRLLNSISRVIKYGSAIG